MEMKISPTRAYSRIFTVTNFCRTRLRLLLVVILVAIASTTTTTAAPITPLSMERKTRMEGWHATDRFSGFRYEIHGTNLSSFKHVLQAKADQLACFGWTQDTPKQTVAGEVRCNKQMGETMKQFLAEEAAASFATETGTMTIRDVIVRDYEDTKIKLHFSHFKILHPERWTCFRDEPHRCDDVDDLV